MDEDLIVVDDIENEAGPSKLPPETDSARPRAIPERVTTRLRSGSSITEPPVAERATRSAGKGRSAPKLKLKLGEKVASQAPGVSFLGQYDRELDSDDEDLSFEEQFILRMPPGEDCEKLRKLVQSREVANDLWFKFKGMCTLPCDVLFEFDMTQTLAGLFSTLEITCTLRSLWTFHVSSSRRRHWTESKCSKLLIFARYDICFVLSCVLTFMVDAGNWGQDPNRGRCHQGEEPKHRRIHLAPWYYPSATPCPKTSVQEARQSTGEVLHLPSYKRLIDL